MSINTIGQSGLDVIHDVLKRRLTHLHARRQPDETLFRLRAVKFDLCRQKLASGFADRLADALLKRRAGDRDCSSVKKGRAVRIEAAEAAPGERAANASSLAWAAATRSHFA